MGHTTLRTARKRRRLTQKKLHELSGVQQTTISRIEGGLGAHPETLNKLEDAMGLRRGSLVVGQEAARLEANQ